MLSKFNKDKDVIHVVAPAGGKPVKHLIESSKLKFAELGYNLDLPDDLIDEQTFFHSNNDDYRLNHLLRLIASVDSKIIWCLSGGYGSAKLIDKLAKLPKPETEKIFIGFSDITALLLFFNQKWGWSTIHGAMIAQISMPDKANPDNINGVLKLIEEGITPNAINVTPLNNFKIDGSISGKIVIGNLAIIQTSIGTDWQINTEDKILIIEDVNEKGYRVERMLFHLKQAGLLESTKAIIFGDFTNAAEADGSNLINYAINNFIQTINIPAFKTDMIGHGYINIPVVEDAWGYIEEKNGNYDFHYKIENDAYKTDL